MTYLNKKYYNLVVASLATTKGAILSSIFEKKVGKNRYLYEILPYRNSDGKPRNKQRIIAKFDSKLGMFVYKSDCYQDKNAKRLPKKAFITKEYGATYFLESISNKIGLSKILEEVFPFDWREILGLAFYLICDDDPVYCFGYETLK